MKVCFGKTSKFVNFLVDSGSQRSYIKESLAKGILRNSRHLVVKKYELKTFVGKTIKPLAELLVRVENLEGHKIHVPVLLDDAFEIKLRLPDLDKAIRNISEAGFVLHDDSLYSPHQNIVLEGLLGIDAIQYLGKLCTVDVLNGTAFMTDRGIIPFGNVDNFLKPSEIKPFINNYLENKELNFTEIVEQYSVSSTYVNFVLHPQNTYVDVLENVFAETNVERNIDKLYNLEQLGISDSEKSNTYDEKMVEKFSESVVFKNGSYYVEMPWKADVIKNVPSNYKIAIAVLNRVVHTLNNKGLLNDYINVFKDQLKEGIIERIYVPPDEFEKYHWIPHRAVIKDGPQSTTKLRPVFNCSLRANGAPSLNDACYAGVNMLSSLLSLILYFRSNNYILLADIRKAFLMINLSLEEDKNKFCFFMYENNKLISYRYKTLIFGLNVSPFILSFILKKHAEKFADDFCTRVLKNNFYVDNLVISHNSVESLTAAYKTTLARMKGGNFDLRSWVSNSTELNATFQNDGVFVEHKTNIENLLGYKYCYESDSIKIAENKIEKFVNTKRELLSQTSKTFDPLGLITPVLIKAKLLVQVCWEKKVGWDEPIPEDVKKDWGKLYNDLTQLHTLDFPRMCIRENQEHELIIFCDASKRAYGFTAYSVNSNGCNLMFSKAKVAPSKKRSLPTMELMGVFLAYKCLPSLLGAHPEIKFKNVTFAVDAQIVLSWLLTDLPKSTNEFANNRVKDILLMKKQYEEKYVLNCSYKYVPGEDNPADLLTRGVSFEEFKAKFQLWTRGPDWLVENRWPVSDLNCLTEKNKTLVQMQTCVSACECNPGVSIIDTNKYSSFNRLINVTSYVLKFIYKCKKQTVDSYKMAINYLTKQMQHEHFKSELHHLKIPEKKNVPCLIKSLSLFVDDNGLLRCKGRFAKCKTLSYEMNNPLLLAKDCNLTKLIILDCHARAKHMGIPTTMVKLQTSGFYVPKIRQQVKKFISPCIICKKTNNLAFKYPDATELPKHRVNFTQPFQHTGVDFTGHIWVGRANETASKRYILLFTCLNIRAVHLELLEDMSVNSFIQAFLRFTNLYGIPEVLYSDNAKTFVAGFEIIKNSFISDAFKEKFALYQIKHHTIPLYSPWVGSCWERLIKTVKMCLYKTIGRKKVSHFDLITILSDIQTAVNSRPLTYRGSDDEFEAITPNSFLKRNGSQCIVVRSDSSNPWSSDPPGRKDLIKSLDLREKTFFEFKEMWFTEYLFSLRENYKNLHQADFENKIKIGDVVIIKLPNKSRPFWPLAMVTELINGTDGKVRSVKVRKSDNTLNVHSLKHLYPLELSDPGEEIKQSQPDSTVADAVPTNARDDVLTSSGRPRRAAADRCRDILRLHTDEFY